MIDLRDYPAYVKLRLKNRLDDPFVTTWPPPQCRIRVLMVADDGGTFDTAHGYALSRVLEAIQHDLPRYVVIDVTTARHASTTPHPSAAVNDLRFNTHDLSQYDQIWLFGVNPGNALQAGEVSALWKFMNGGGGIFATGDHENLGEALCARIPRVRSMRRWYYPAPGPHGEPPAPARDVGGGRGENDSTTPGIGSDFDGVAQTIRPVMYSAPSAFVFLGSEYPHPLLCGKDGMITKLPDHMHEGVVEVPADLEMPIDVDGAPVEEYPRRGPDRLAPEVIAYSTINNNPRDGVFGVIGAYDGHLVDEVPGGVGRIVVDSTWHHFWNMNVDQFAVAHDAVAQAVAAGVAPDLAWIGPANAWEQMRDYFQNIAFWLARPSVQRCIRRRGVWYVLSHVNVQMALRSTQSDRVTHLIDLGVKARDALQQIAPQCERLRMIWELPEHVAEEMIPWRIPPDPRVTRQIPLFQSGLIDDLALGAQVEAAAHATASATSTEEVAKLLNDDSFDNELAEAARTAMDLLGKRFQSDGQRLRQIARGDRPAR
jgi:hypothetical protein